jgi:hypothetical protein
MSGRCSFSLLAPTLSAAKFCFFFSFQVCGDMEVERVPKKRGRQETIEKDGVHPRSVAGVIAAQEAAKKNKVHHGTRVPLKGFQLMQKGTFEWRGSGGSGEVMLHHRNPMLKDIFFELCPKGVLQAMNDQ